MSQRWVKKTTLFYIQHIFSARYIFHINSCVRELLGLISWPAQKIPLMKEVGWGRGGDILGNYKKTRMGSSVDNFCFGFRSASKISHTNSYNRRQESWIAVWKPKIVSLGYLCYNSVLKIVSLKEKNIFTQYCCVNLQIVLTLHV